jgi:hypothetical protein
MEQQPSGNEVDDSDMKTQDYKVDDSDMQTQAYEAAEEDQLPPSLQAADAESEAMEKGCTLPVPEVGAKKIMVLGRQTLESASAWGCPIPGFLQQERDIVDGHFLLDDKRGAAQPFFRNVTRRLHAAVRVTRTPENELRLEIRDCTRITRPAGRTRILRNFETLTVQDDNWTSLQHDDVIHICPIIIGGVGLQPTEYNVHKYVVSIPWTQHVRTEEAVAQRDVAHFLKFVLPQRLVGKVLGKGGLIKEGIQKEHSCSIEVANRKNIYPGTETMQGQVIGITSSTAAGMTPALHAVMTVAEIPAALQEGFYILMPVRTALSIQENDGLKRIKERCPQGNIKLSMRPPADASFTEQILKCEGGGATIDDILHVVTEVLKHLGPKETSGYAPVAPIHETRSGAASGNIDTDQAAGGDGRRWRAAQGQDGDERHGKAPQGQDGDKTLTCRHCERKFLFTVDEQEYHKEKGYTNEPRRCQTCKEGKNKGTNSKVARDQAAGRGDNTARNKVLKNAQKAVRNQRKSLRGNKGKQKK